MSLQGITVAISQSGIHYFTNELIASKILALLEVLKPPGRTIDVGNVKPYTDVNNNKMFYFYDLVITLSNGTLTNFKPTFSELKQGANGEFTLTMIANQFVANYDWNEQYTSRVPISDPFGGQHPGNPKKENKNYKYSFTLKNMNIPIVFKLGFSQGIWQLTFVSANANGEAVTPNIPAGSIVKKTNCYDPQLKAASKKAINSIDFSGTILKEAKESFKGISSTGIISPDISFEFPVGPSGLTFPKNTGIAAGVTGNTLYKGQAFDGANPPQLALPEVPPSHHLSYFTSDYTFNGLMWAFYKSGDLKTTVTPGDLPEPGVLNTSNFKVGGLSPLYREYPNTPMTATISAAKAPTVLFKKLYDLTKDAYDALSTIITDATVYQKLSGMVATVYMDEASFFKDLVSFIGQIPAEKYKHDIETASLIPSAFTLHSNQVILNVLSDGNTIPVITFDVAQTDIMFDLELGISGKTQTLQFKFQMIDNLTTTKFVSSTINGINSGNFDGIWKYALSLVFAGVVESIGKAGVALPRIPGFNFLFKNAEISPEVGYIQIITDVVYESDTNLENYKESKKSVISVEY